MSERTKVEHPVAAPVIVVHLADEWTDLSGVAACGAPMTMPPESPHPSAYAHENYFMPIRETRAPQTLCRGCAMVTQGWHQQGRCPEPTMSDVMFASPPYDPTDWGQVSRVFMLLLAVSAFVLFLGAILVNGPSWGNWALLAFSGFGVPFWSYALIRRRRLLRRHG